MNYIRFTASFLVAFMQLFSMETSAQMKVVEVISVDSVTADFPVNFSTVAKNGWQFIAYYNATRNLTVASRKKGSGSWTKQILPTQVGWDNHNYITMAIDRENQLHVSGNMHNDSMLYFKTLVPYEVTSFKRVFPLVALEDELSSTYPAFFRDSEDRLIFSYRKGGSGNGNNFSNIYDEKGGTFKRLTNEPVFDGLNDKSAYAGKPERGPDGYFHQLWVWRDTPRAETNHSLSYTKTKDFVHYETADGQRVALPITPDKKQFIIDPVPAGGGIINGGFDLFFVGSLPAVAYYKYDKNGNHQIYVAKFDGKEWNIKQVSNWDFRWDFSGPGSLTFEINILKVETLKNGQIRIQYWQKNDGFGEILVDSASLKTISERKIINPELALFPAELLQTKRPDTMVKWLKMPTDDADYTYYFRWEAMGKRRFYEKRENAEPPELLQLYKFRR